VPRLERHIGRIKVAGDPNAQAEVASISEDLAGEAI
jgi:hypothetical protein